MIGIGSAMKTLVVFQSQKMLILPEQDKVFRLYYFLSSYPNRRRANQSHMWLTWTSINMWYIGFFRICQFLLTIYLEI